MSFTVPSYPIISWPIVNQPDNWVEEDIGISYFVQGFPGPEMKPPNVLGVWRQREGVARQEIDIGQVEVNLLEQGSGVLVYGNISLTRG